MQKYETLYILEPHLSDEQVEEIVRTFEAITPDNKGNVIRTDKWGKRKLAYRMGKHWEGHYVLYEYEGTGAIQRELERRLKIHDNVMRFLTTAVDPRMAAELERKAEREKRTGGRMDDGEGGWGGEGRFGDRDRDRDYDRGPRRDRGDRDREERS